MNEHAPFERRLTTLLGRLADRVETDVDPTAVARLAAAGARSGRVGWVPVLRLPRAGAWIVIALALGGAFAWGLLVGGAGRSGPVVSATPTPGSVQLAREVIAHYQRFHSGYVYVYGNGLVLSLNDNFGPWVLQERRLTQEGVRLVRSAVVAPSAFLDPSTQLPESAWAEPEGRPYAPSTQAICYWNGPVLVPAGFAVRDLPASAQALLRDKERTYTTDGLQRLQAVCSEVTTEEAATLADILAAAGAELAPDNDGGYPTTLVLPALGSAEASEIVVGKTPILPHGTWVFWGG
jgi:hypothetical protein